MMVAHTHDDDDRITFGCPGCIARAEQARIDNAPLRRVTWHCSYYDPTENGYSTQHELSFTLDVRVPDGWGPDKVDEQYAGLTGEAFVLALPDDIPMNLTDHAAEFMEVERVVIGDLVDTVDGAPAQSEQLPL